MKWVLSLSLLVTIYLELTTAGWLNGVIAVALGVYLLKENSHHEERAKTDWFAPAHFVWFSLGAVWEIAKGAWVMLVVLLSPRRWKEAAVVEVPVQELSERGAVITALVFTASPGTAVARFESEPRRLVFHTVEGNQPDKLRNDVKEFYERFQKRIFP